MNHTCPTKNQRGNTMLVVVVAILLVLAIAFVFFKQNSSVAVSALPTLPPVAERTNPQPTSGYTVSVGTVEPGTTLMVDSATVSQSASIVVILDNARATTLGKSSLLPAGSHQSISIKLSPATKDGDVVIIRLVDTNGKTIVNADKQPIEVKKNVGHLMTHYSSEY